MSDNVTKIIEETNPLKERFNIFYFLSQKLIESYKNKYKYLHLGMIQVGLISLTILG